MGTVKKPIPVTSASVPDEARYLEYIKDILGSRRLTNGGPYAEKFEQRLERLLGARVSLCANGTMALQLALRAAGINGKPVVTTPFTYVATLSALLWEGCSPVFVDIDEETLCLSPQRLAETDLSRVAGIMPVHPYGNACDVEALSEIASAAGIVSIYDAAQAFGCLYRDKPLVGYGDFSVISFHATKLVHSIEGGAVVSHSEETKKQVNLLRSFGHIGDEHYSLGINAKLSEPHAAMGLCTLDEMRENIRARGRIVRAYDEAFPLRGLGRPKFSPFLDYSNQYYPVIFESEERLLKAVAALNKEEIYPRRYFYPSLTELPYVAKASCPVAEDAAHRALCLPVYGELPLEVAALVMDIIRSVV